LCIDPVNSCDYHRFLGHNLLELLYKEVHVYISASSVAAAKGPTGTGPGGPLTVSSSVPAPSVNGLLDDVNKSIVEELQKDGRRTYGAIAEAVGLSEAAVRQRVQKMRDAGIMQIVAVTDPLQVGFRSQAMVGIRADGDTRMVADRLAAVEDIDYVVMCTGSFDILVELVCEDEDAILELLNGVIRQIPGVRDTETFMYLRLTKQTYTWGTR
jgi:Lrp/AsnC family transcriptional regulator for asnA, asnC and gidA